MKNVGIHVLDFNDNIIDFISQSDGALINAEMSMNVEEKSETFDFTIENTRAEKLRERNRIIAQDNNGTFREFIIIHVADNFDGTTEIECNASYLEDLKTAKPIKPGKFEAHTTTQALLKTLADTGWEVSDDTEYGGNRTTSWTSHTNPFDLIYMLCTTYSMVPSFYIELGAHTVEHRYVSITKPKNLFKGKEITKGKDLTGMTRTIDLSEVKTALFAVGPEKEDGSRIETVVVDDEAQEIFGLPNRYIWDVYEPETEDENMTLKRLTTLAKTELNKRNQAAISYEVSSIDIHKYYNDVTVDLRDIVRVKDRDFRPPLYIEAEVIGIKYNWLADESEFTFGNVIEYEETKLREFFNRKLDEITKKLNDSISNVNTIVSDVVAGELEYYERKIFKGAEPPENPQNDTLWYDTSNSDVAVLRRYWDGEWITQTADDVEKIGGLRREQVMYRDLNNSFINLTIQHSKLQNDVYDVLNNEYLVDDDLKANLNQALSDVDNVYQNIKTNLDSMDEDTATIGKLVDTQTLFTVYREKLQTLYKYVTDAKISIDKRLKLLQSQYTDEKFNDAMDKIAQTLPNGRWDSENQQLYADIPNRNEVENLKTTLQEYTDGQISNLNNVLGKEIDSKINTTKNEISASISSVERKIDGIEVGGRNLIRNSKKITDYVILASIEKAGTYSLGFEPHFTEKIPSEFGVYYGGNIDILANDKPRITHTFEVSEDRIGKDIRLFFGGTYKTHKDFVNKGYISKVKLEYGDFATDWTPAPEDIEDKILNSKQDAEEAAKAYAKAQDELKQTEIQAYADGIVSKEEQRAIADAIAKRDEAKEYAEQKAQEAQESANQNTSDQLEPIATRITTNETNITELDERINLMAKSDDVAQKLKDVDGRLTPLETTVQSNKATLDILPTQIDSKVSKEDYTLDKDDIVERLNNADSERKQLSNEITDKVSVTEYNSGIDSVKSTNRNYLQSYYSPHQNIVNGVINGAYSVTLNANRTLNFYFYDRGNGINPTLEENTDYILKIHESDQNVRMGVFYNKGSNTIVGYTTDNVIRFNTKTYQDIRIVLIPNVDSHFIGKMSLYKGTKELDWTPAPEDIEMLAKKSQQDAEKASKAYTDAQDNLKETQLKAYADGIVSDEEQRAIQDAKNKLEMAKADAQSKANAAQTAAEEYAVIKANNAETNAKAYTDEYKQSNDVAMTKLETSISQNGDKIALKVDEQKFNASRKTLSQVISEISATTKGINLSYDENGNIQSYTMDKNGIQLRGDKVDITVNKDFNVMASRVDDKVGKGEIINRLNLSPEGLDINMNNIGIRGGDNIDYIDIRNNSILSYGSFTRTWANETDTANLRLGIQGGTVKVQNRTTGYNLYLTEKGLSTMLAGAGDETAGTLEFHSTKYNDTSRGVRLHSTYGAVALESDYSRIILNANLTVNIESNYGIYFRPYRDNRTGNNEFAMYVKQNDSGAYTDGVIKYGNVSSDTSQYGSGIRFSKSSINSTIYATNKDGDIGTGHFFADKLYGDLTAKGSNGYILVDDALRITNKKGYNNGDVRYKDLQCLDVQANSIRVNTAKDFYIGVSTGELRVTNNLRYNGGDTGYKDIRFANWHAMSSEKFKYDIKEWNYSVLDAFRNDLRLYSYKLNSEKETNYARNHHGIIIEREIPIEWRHGDGFDGNEVMFWNTKAIQELISILDKQNKQMQKLEEQLNEQSITS
ncbi:phage tail spike protein [Staphylococcus hominis]|uniref:phage tail spike protein n=1 Tax=Staphylococcus hominis TaxID=1290 RepID=UPI00030797BC|nr:phage tail spike protein [Staphylococcus hominis]